MYSSIEKLKKFFKLERERRFDNRAIVGGLDKVVPAWKSEALANQLPDELIQTIIKYLQAYPLKTAESRETIIDSLTAAIDNPDALSTLPNLDLLLNHEETPIHPENAPDNQMIDHEGEEQPTVSAPSPARGARVQTQAAFNAPLTVIHGIGAKYADKLARLNLHTLEDLLYLFPRRYDDYTQLKPINRLQYDEEVTVLGTIKAIQTRPIRGGKTQLTEAVITDGTGTLRISWFNQPWLTNTYRPGTQIAASGKLSMYLGKLVMNSPEMEELEKEHLHTSRIVPVYPLTEGVTHKWLRRTMHQTIAFWAQRVQDYLPDSVRKNMKMVDLGVAIQQIHFPDSQDTLDQARWRLAFDEIFLLQLGVMRQKRAWQSAEARVFETDDDWLSQQIARLPYLLTGAQQRALQAIQHDLRSGRPMDRLLQGDVGSGKTIVAALGIAMITRHGAQAAIMAPTSILAEQHYRNLTSVLCAGDEAHPPLLEPTQIRLLVGDTREAEKEEIRSGLVEGQIKLLIGTHALIEEPVQFQDLHLLVIDEQHRFGVAQRSALRAKGNNPHLLVMTATPIPRSLALTVYGDLDLTVMDEMPPGRQPVETHILHPLERERAYHLINNQVDCGQQAFIIYPMVEENENGDNLAAVEEHLRLQKEIFPNRRIGLMHGRLRPDEKDDVMAKFRNRDYDILISTSVVEVGVDVPNATVMLIEGANRFGLAQLHQFRGRVGRGGEKSYCLLIPDHEDAIENERLAVMAETSDGFVLAERDLEQRGPGEFLGTRQAGFSELKMANLTDVKLIEKARQQAQLLFEKDPDLTNPEHDLLLDKLNRFWGEGRGDIS